MKKRIAIWSLLLLTVALLAGCAEQATPPAEETAAEPVAEPVAEEIVAAVFEMTPDLEVKLAAADLLDGAEDKVVARCPGCGLAMDGSAEHAAHAGDYALHFCTAECKDAFSEDLAGSLMAMALPEAEAPTEQ
jgi:L-aminopeptidase/D-esterase-like protein